MRGRVSNRRDAVAEGIEGAEIGVDDVDAEASVVERDAAIDEEHVAALLDGHAVHADLAEAAERQHPQTRGIGRKRGRHAIDLARRG
jgi:hypothetical protein